MIPADLAPGDLKSLERDWSSLELHRVPSADSPLFAEAFDALWKEFGALGELEQPSVLARRLNRNGPSTQPTLQYDLMVLKAGGQLAAVLDQTALAPRGHGEIFVHLSHNLLVPEWRRTGLAGWLRALPLLTARELLSALGKPMSTPITLVGEVEHPDPARTPTLIRLRAFEKAGFLKIDPHAVNFRQPDFRAPEEIDRQGRPLLLPLSLVIRRVGREGERELSGQTARDIIAALYQIYAEDFRKKDMEPLFQSLQTLPPATARIALLPPTAAVVPPTDPDANYNFS